MSPLTPALAGALSAALLLVPYLVLWPAVRLLAALRRARGAPLRVLYAPLPIVNVIYAARADRLRGRRADTLVYSTYYVTRDFTYDLSRVCRNRFSRFLVSHLIFLWALLRYDAFQFFSDRGLLPAPGRSGFNRAELPLLKLAGKKVIISTYGADVRTRKRTLELGEYNCCMDCPAVGEACICDQGVAGRNRRHLARWADLLLSMGDMTEYTPGSRNDLFFWPVDVEELAFAGAEPREGPVRVLHAPNHRHYKGTRFLEAAIAALRAEGLAVELQIVEGAPRETVLQACRAADIIADQFIAGFHGYFALEAMALGKPVVCFIRRPDQYLPAGKDCPIVNADPDGLTDALRELVTDGRRRAELGERGRRFVEEVFSLETFGRRMDAVYGGLFGKAS